MPYVMVLVAAAGPEIIVEAGTTRAELQTILDEADDGARIVIQPQTIDHDSTPIYIAKGVDLDAIDKSLVTFFADGDVGDSYGGGATHQFVIGLEGGSVANVHLRNFTIEHDRVASPDMRTIAIDIAFGPTSNVEIDHIGFTNITSDCLIIRPYPWDVDPGCTDLSFHHCVANEFWEGFFNFHVGFLETFTVHDNTGTVSNAHVGYQGPMGLEINIEQHHGAAIGGDCYNNVFTVTGGAGGSGALGVVFNGNGNDGNVLYDDITIHHNTFDGFFYGCFIPMINYTNGTITATTATLTIADNEFANQHSDNIFVWPDSNEPTWRTGSDHDTINLLRNHGVGGDVPTFDQSRLGVNGEINIVDTDNVWE